MELFDAGVVVVGGGQASGVVEEGAWRGDANEAGFVVQRNGGGEVEEGYVVLEGGRVEGGVGGGVGDGAHCIA